MSSGQAQPGPRCNWAGNHVYRARILHRPRTLEEVCEILAGAEHIRVLGSRHSFTAIADGEEQLTLAGLPANVRIDRAAGTVSCGGALTYGEVARALVAEGLALANLASLPHISVAGAIATGTHGSGDGNGTLATGVAALRLVTSDGQVREFRRGDPDFDGAVVGLGALGAVTRVTLDVEPAYAVRQWVHEGLSWDALRAHLDEITSSGYSVSCFTRWGDAIDQVWIKTRDSDTPPLAPPGTRVATVERHPLLGLDPVNCTPQLGVPGPWSERLPHFRMGFTPSAGEEIQSEYLVPRGVAREAIDAVRALGERIAPLVQVSELRTIAADTQWMSPAYDRDSLAIHFTWVARPEPVALAARAVEEALAEFGARPHWGKLFIAGAARTAPLYPRHGDFVALRDRLDPRGALRNRWLKDHVLGS